ncbi:hypothetical protein BH23BAC4_BH23BAC4_03380 [soil metagenome]
MHRLVTAVPLVFLAFLIGACATTSPATQWSDLPANFVESPDSPPRLMSLGIFEYTAEARRQRVQGRAVVEGVVDERGRVIHSRVRRGPGHGLDAEALRAVRGAEFQPAMHEGRAVSAPFVETVTFRLN